MDYEIRVIVSHSRQHCGDNGEYSRLPIETVSINVGAFTVGSSVGSGRMTVPLQTLRIM